MQPRTGPNTERILAMTNREHHNHCGGIFTGSICGREVRFKPGLAIKRQPVAQRTKYLVATKKSRCQMKVNRVPSGTGSDLDSKAGMRMSYLTASACERRERQ